MIKQNIRKDQRLQVLTFLKKKRDSYKELSDKWYEYHELYLKILLPF